MGASGLSLFVAGPNQTREKYFPIVGLKILATVFFHQQQNTLRKLVFCGQTIPQIFKPTIDRKPHTQDQKRDRLLPHVCGLDLHPILRALLPLVFLPVVHFRTGQ